MENKVMDMEKLAKELRLTRVFCAISSMMTIGLLVGGFILLSSLEPIFTFLQEAQPVIEQMSALDVEALNTAIEGIDTEELSEAIENLNKTADTLESWGEKLGSLF